MGRRELLKKAQLAYLGVGILSLSLVAFFYPLSPSSVSLWLILPALALLAEFLPVVLSNRGLRITFTLPYVAGMAVATGPMGAVLTDVLVTLLAGIAIGAARRQKITPVWVMLNLSVAAISCSIAGVCHRLIMDVGDGARGSATLAALCFALIYGAVNFSLVAFLERLTQKGSGRSNLKKNLRFGAQGVVLYGLMAVAVSILVHRGLVQYVPLTLLPIWALRTGLMMQARMYEHYYETISALSHMLQRAHPYTHGHLERVAWLAGEAAIRLGMSDDRARKIREAAILHDIGKIAIDEEILDKPGRLTPEEYEHVKQHSHFGAAILSTVEPFRDMVHWVRHHHERPDGAGYPDKLQDSEIPLESKIIAVADAYDAMTGTEIGGRTYREPMSQAEAIQELKRFAGTQFDRRVVESFAEILSEGA